MLSSFSFSATTSTTPKPYIKLLATNERLRKFSDLLYQFWIKDDGSSIEQLRPLLKTITELQFTYPSLLREDVVFDLRKKLDLIHTMLVSELRIQDISASTPFTRGFSNEDISVFPTLTSSEIARLARNPTHITNLLFRARDHIDSICLPFTIDVPSDEEANEERRIDHLTAFGSINIALDFPLPSGLNRIENIKLLNALARIIRHDRGPFVISPIIDHWTTIKNLRSIIKCNSFYGNNTLSQNKILFTGNALDVSDYHNLDGDVICFCPGKFVDHGALATIGNERNSSLRIRDGLVRIRIDLRNAEKTRPFNTFFKIVDLRLSEFSLNVIFSDIFSIKIKNNVEEQLIFFFNLAGKEEITYLNRDELIFYGDYKSFNSIALLLLFIAVEKSQNKSFVNQVYKYLAGMSEEDFQRAIICFAQIATIFSEYNSNIRCRLMHRLIHDIHLVSKNRTYHLHKLSTQEYNQALTDILNMSPFSTQIPTTKEKILSLTMKGGLQLYGKEVVSLDDDCADFGTVNVEALPRWDLSEGYVEMRLGTQEVSSLEQSGEQSPPVQFAFEKMRRENKSQKDRQLVHAKSSSFKKKLI